ncbi:Maf-like protein [Alteraurantiacibacter aestuarii]|uniref:Nucleoside triphosphate pyrophosphatase n=1 Tax=Alteraurantiacibacter aestuarii TaxID=650004 RepID=A0A844ZLF1_9SPHN|nr:Maf family protein [Alteraurantiacibacter aestuarii]MXO88598.1 septum formation protein Maf [Alteraurantiacibacter aestuarii]
MIILASKSASRKAMLDAAGVRFDARSADIDERALEQQLEGALPGRIAVELAKAKALAVDGGESLVLGSDSLVVAGGRRFDKPGSRDEAARHLRFFSGREMQLHSAAAIAQRGEIVWSCAAMASLHVRPLSESFIEAYLDEEWPQVSYCVGVFRIEGPGVQLFEQIEGDHFTVLGMPLLQVLAALRNLGEMPA